MKATSIVTTVLTALMITGAARTNAGTTNSVQNISFELTFFTQGPTNHPSADITTIKVDKFRVTSKDIIAALGEATTNNFSAKARLVSVRDATSTNSVRYIEVRDGTNIVDVSRFFNLTTSETNVISVRSSNYNSITEIDSGVVYSIIHLTLTQTNLTASLNLSGFASTKHTSIKDGGIVLGVDEIDAAVAGSGMGTNGVPAIATGRMNFTGKTLKVE
jgi:hypothetical protein